MSSTNQIYLFMGNKVEDFLVKKTKRMLASAIIYSYLIMSYICSLGIRKFLRGTEE